MHFVVRNVFVKAFKIVFHIFTVKFAADPVKFEAASLDIVQQYEEFGRRLLTDETDLYRKRLSPAVYTFIFIECILTDGTCML